MPCILHCACASLVPVKSATYGSTCPPLHCAVSTSVTQPLRTWLLAWREALTCIGLGVRDARHARHAGLWWRSGLWCMAVVALWRASHCPFSTGASLDHACRPCSLSTAARRSAWRRLAAQINADKGANGLAVVDRVFGAFVRQAEALQGHVYAQHARQPGWETTSAFDLRIERLDQFVQLVPRGHAIDLGQEAIASRQLLFCGVFKVGKTLLHGRKRTVAIPILSQVGPPQGTVPDE